MNTKWPKKMPPLTDEQQRIKDDFMKHWHEVLPRRYAVIERFNHGFPVKHAQKKAGRVLEIGAGMGEHIRFENLANTEYVALELRKEMTEVIRRRFPAVITLVGDCQKALPFSGAYFDRVLAIHVLEHLPNLPAALEEVSRVLKPDGQFEVVIPCEGGLAYSFARRISAQRVFEKRYNMAYDWCIQSEHINTPQEILHELRKFFIVKTTRYFPLIVPSITFNLVIGVILIPKK